MARARLIFISMCNSTPLPPTSEIGVQIPANLKWQSWYLIAVGKQFREQNLNQMHVIVSSAHKITCRDMTYPMC